MKRLDLLTALVPVVDVTRYPEDLATLQRDYTEEVVRELLKKTKEAVKWIKSILKT